MCDCAFMNDITMQQKFQYLKYILFQILFVVYVVSSAKHLLQNATVCFNFTIKNFPMISSLAPVELLFISTGQMSITRCNGLSDITSHKLLLHSNVIHECTVTHRILTVASYHLCRKYCYTLMYIKIFN